MTENVKPGSTSTPRPSAPPSKRPHQGPRERSGDEAYDVEDGEEPSLAASSAQDAMLAQPVEEARTEASLKKGRPKEEGRGKGGEKDPDKDAPETPPKAPRRSIFPKPAFDATQRR